MKNEIEQTKLQIVDLKDSNKDLIRLLTSGNNSSKSVPPNKYKYNETNTQTTHKKLNFPNIKESQSTMKTITPKTKPNSESQVPKEREKSQSVSTIDDKNDNAYDNFVEVKKRHRRNKNIGTNSVSEAEEQGFEGRDNMLSSNKTKNRLFISRIKDSVSVTEDTVKKYISKKTGTHAEETSAKKLETFHKTKDNNCFLVGVNPSLKDTVYKENFWPRGVAFSRFNFNKGQHFLDNPRQNHNEGTEDNSFNTRSSNFLETPMNH
ncbi:hypothetical protein JTB14_026198 [Gonioctena quinquepunctata]|nr:hypothetical protein JTB14_026198 [Gonioctena quinquepunctata]